MSRSATITEIENGFTIECSEEKEECWESKTFHRDLIGDAISKALEFLTTDPNAPQTDVPQAKGTGMSEGTGTLPPPAGSVSD